MEWIQIHSDRLHPDSVETLRRTASERGQAMPALVPAQPASTAKTLLDPLTPQPASFAPADLARFTALHAADWLEFPVRTQRHLPKRCTHMVATTVAQVYREALNDERPAPERQLFLMLFLLSPRWLWPEPPRPNSDPLPPHTRPRLIQSRAELWADGHLHELLLLALGHDAPLPRPAASQAAAPPGTMERKAAERLLQAAKAGRHTLFWKHLYSFGLAPPGADTVDQLQRKWLPTRAAQACPTWRASPRDAGLLCQHAQLRRACSSLTTGAAVDSLGWHHEALQALVHQPPFADALHDLCQRYLTQDLGDLGLDVINSSVLVPLRKGTSGNVRPLALPTVFRKLVGKMAVSTWKRSLCDLSSPHQFAALRSHGAHLCAREARNLISPRSTNVLVRCDIANAFNSVDRAAVLHALHEASPELARSQAAWLSRPSLALAPLASGRRAPLFTEVGIPQGDPLSSLAFTATLGPLLRTLPPRGVTPLAFADDVMLICSRAAVLDDLRHWQRTLQGIGLSLSLEKTAVWDPRADAAFAARFQEAYPGTVVSADGVTICGLPVAELGSEDIDWLMAWGDDRYVAAFLRHSQHMLSLRLRALSQFTELLGPDSPAAHIALQVLRLNLLPRFTHLFRFLPLRLTLPWAKDLDADLLTWLENLLRLPLRAAPNTWVLLTPPSRGGLGLTPLVIESLLHCLAGTVALTVAGEHPMTRDEAADAALARTTLMDLVGIDPLTIGRDLLPHRRPAKLRQATYDGLSVQMLRHNPWLTPPALNADAERAGITLAFHHRVCLAWLTAPADSLLHAGPLRMRLAAHMHVPLLSAQARCQYRGSVHHGPCNHPLDAHAHHIFACGQGPRQHKHDRLRNAWAHLLRQAGWHVSPEQIVNTTGGPHRADLVAIPPTGIATALDIHVTAPLTPIDPCGPQLHRATLAKAARYHTYPDGPLPGDLRLVPVTYSATVPFLHVSALRLLHRVLHDLASRTMSPDAALWGIHFARITQQATAALAHAHAVGSYRQLLACAGPTVS